MKQLASAGSGEEEDDDAGSTAGMAVGAVLKGEHGARISAAVVGVAKKVESNVVPLLAAAAGSAGGKQQGSIPGALVIKQVRKATGKLLAAKRVADTPNPLQ